MDNTKDVVEQKLKQVLPADIKLDYCTEVIDMFGEHWEMMGPKKGFLGLSTENFGDVFIQRDDNRFITELTVYLENTVRANALKAAFELFNNKFGLIKSVMVRR